MDLFLFFGHLIESRSWFCSLVRFRFQVSRYLLYWRVCLVCFFLSTRIGCLILSPFTVKNGNHVPFSDVEVAKSNESRPREKNGTRIATGNLFSQSRRLRQFFLMAQTQLGTTGLQTDDHRVEHWVIPDDISFFFYSGARKSLQRQLLVQKCGATACLARHLVG